MPIWFNPSLGLDYLQSFEQDTMNNHIGIEFTEIGDDYIKARMPVDHRTRQAYGILHGGASVALAETVGSVGSVLIVDPSKYYCVGVEINANHIRSIKEGFVIAKATPLHLGSSTHVWDIKITDEAEKLICVSRLTVYILKKP
ncbi:MAG: hotdog fold thioesterase [Bacteroidetes bacterium]|nr:hotdog fold thioesterase [Bacteroidota bacterium]